MAPYIEPRLGIKLFYIFFLFSFLLMSITVFINDYTNDIKNKIYENIIENNSGVDKNLLKENYEYSIQLKEQSEIAISVLQLIFILIVTIIYIYTFIYGTFKHNTKEIIGFSNYNQPENTDLLSIGYIFLIIGLGGFIVFIFSISVYKISNIITQEKLKNLKYNIDYEDLEVILPLLRNQG